MNQHALAVVRNRSIKFVESPNSDNETIQNGEISYITVPPNVEPECRPRRHRESSGRQHSTVGLLSPTELPYEERNTAELERRVHNVETVSQVNDDAPEAFSNLPQEMWSLPSVVKDSALRDLHTQLLKGLRRDAMHLPTGTLQAMQLERIAYYYIYIRWRDTHNSWLNDKDRSATYKLWRDLSSDFCAVAYGNKISPEALHGIVATHTAKVVAHVLRTLPAAQSRPLYAKFAAALESGPEVG